MELTDITFVPHNDTGANDKSIMQEHNRLINQHKYQDATTLLDNYDFQKGLRASVFNYLESKLNKLAVFLLNKFVASKDEYYSLTEPTEEEMGSKLFWIQIYN